MSHMRTQIWGWGYEDKQPTPEEKQTTAREVAQGLGRDGVELAPEPSIDDIELRPPRIAPPESLAALCSSETYDRAAHTYGKAVPDVMRAFHREFPNPPDVVGYPVRKTTSCR